MKRKAILAIVIMAIMLAPLWAQSEDDFEVTQNRDNTLTITNYKGSAKDVVIPGTLYGIRVTAIGREAFQNKGLTSVVIPNTVVTIGEDAFNNMWSWKGASNNFTEVIIPNSVTTIGSSAFYECGITKLSLGTGVQNIYYQAFSYNKISELTLPASLKIIGDYAFIRNQIKSLTIPNGVTLVSMRAFTDNPLETLVIPASLAAERTNRTGLFPEVFEQSNEYGMHTGNKTLTRITMPANMVDRVLDSLGFEDSFVNFYKSQNKAAGTYVKNGPIWRRQ